jgi:hypothetical protein
VITTWQAKVAKLSPESRAVLHLRAWYADPACVGDAWATEVLALASDFGPAPLLSVSAAAEPRIRGALTELGGHSHLQKETPPFSGALKWLRGWDLNPRPFRL